MMERSPVPDNKVVAVGKRGSTNELEYPREVKEMIEVKTSSNYKIGKATINQRMGEDSEPSKPIVQNYGRSDQESSPTKP